MIATIRASADPDTARTALMGEFELSEIQAQAILAMPLQRLTGLERDKIKEELAEIKVEIEQLRAILADERLLLNLIIEELEAI